MTDSKDGINFSHTVCVLNDFFCDQIPLDD